MKDKIIDSTRYKNDTGMFAVAVDGYFQLFPSREEAKRVFDSVGGNPEWFGDELAETPFGSAQMIAPGGSSSLYEPWEIAEPYQLLSEMQQIDMVAYIATRKKRRRYRPPEAPPNLMKRFAWAKQLHSEGHDWLLTENERRVLQNGERRT